MENTTTPGSKGASSQYKKKLNVEIEYEDENIENKVVKNRKQMFVRKASMKGGGGQSATGA